MMCQTGDMPRKRGRAPAGGRADALSRQIVVGAAIALLDELGERGLTFRLLAERLNTGSGALYWHVASKSELLDAAADTIVAAAVAVKPAGSSQDEIRAIALGLFDAIDEHPWVATQLATELSRSPWQLVMLRILESIGQQIRALGVPEDMWFTASSALVHYILGTAGQNATNGRILGPGTDRGEFLDAASRAWKELDPDDYPFTRAVADQMRGHDDRDQFLAGIDLILAGIAALST
jgi:AcrR family transcriptional regulator